MASIQGIYIALFGRPADPVGLAYFNQVTKNGADLTAIGDLARTEEYQSRFKGMSSTEIVTSIYKSLLNRAPEPAGLTFWLGKLADGSITINTIAIAILDGATGSDRATIEAKIAIAGAFTSSLDTPEEVTAYNGLASAKLIQDYLSGITWEKLGTMPELHAILKKLLNPDAPIGGGEPDGGGSPGGGSPGTTPLDVHLTTAVDHIVGTSGNDKVTGIAGGAGRTFGPSDTIDGGDGIDTLKLTLNGWVTIDGAKVTHVEKFIFSNPQGYMPSADLTGVADITDVIIEDLDLASDITLTLDKSVDITLRDSKGPVFIDNLLVDLGGSSDHLGITLEQVGCTCFQAVIIFRAYGSSGYESVSITSTGNQTNYLSFIPALMPVTTGAVLTIDGAADLELQFLQDWQEFATIDASAATGAITIYSTGESSTPITAKLGSGNDTVFDAAVYDNFALLDGGDGTDKLVIEDGAADLSWAINFEILRIETVDSFSRAAGPYTKFELDGYGAFVDPDAELTGLQNDSEIALSGFLGAVDLSLADGSGGADVLNLRLDAVDTTAAMSDIAGLETLNIEVSAHTLNALATDIQARHVLTGAGDLSLYTVALNIDAAAMTGSLELFLDNDDDHVVTTGSGDDSVSTGDGDDDIRTGDGDDVVRVSGTIDGNDYFDGGDGTDRLVIGSETADLSRAVNFEILDIEGGSDDIQQDVTGFAEVHLHGPDDGSVPLAELTGLGHDAVLELSGAYTAITLTLAQPDSGVDDVLTLRLDNVLNPTAIYDVTGLDVLNVEVAENSSNGLALAVTGKLVITGAGDLSLGTFAAAIDASGLTGHFSLGTSPVDPTDREVVLGSNTGNIYLGLGNDTITLGTVGSNFQSGAGTISTGDGHDKVIFVGSNKGVTGLSTSYGDAIKVADFTGGDDKLGFSGHDADFRTLAPGADEADAVTGLSKGAVAQGLDQGDAMLVQDIAANQSTVLASADVGFFKLSGNLDLGSASDIATLLEAAVGNTRIAGLAQGGNYLLSFYDGGYGSNGAAILAVVNTGDDDVLDADDFVGSGVSIVGLIEMTSADYTGFNASSLLAVV